MSVLGPGAANVRRDGKRVWFSQDAVEAAKRYFATSGRESRCVVQAFADARPCRPDETDIVRPFAHDLYVHADMPDVVFVACGGGDTWRVRGLEWRTAGSEAAVRQANAVAVTRMGSADNGYPHDLWADVPDGDPAECRAVLVDRKRAAERWCRANPADPRRGAVVERMHAVDDLIRRAKAGQADGLAEKVKEMDRRLMLVESKLMGGGAA